MGALACLSVVGKREGTGLGCRLRGLVTRCIRADCCWCSLVVPTAVSYKIPWRLVFLAGAGRGSSVCVYSYQIGID